MNLEKINVGGNEYDICDAKTRAMVSDEYDPEGDYVAGDLCIHDNKLHEAKGPTTGAWDSTKWEGRTLAEVLKSQNSKIEGLSSRLIQTQIFDGTVTCEANVQKNITNYTVPDGYTLMCFDIQISGTSAVSKGVSLYHTDTNIYMCAEVAQDYMVKIRATYFKS